MKTLAELKVKIKRRLRDIKATTGAGVETETGNRHSDGAITDAINAGRQKIVSIVLDADLWANQLGVITTVTDIQDYGFDTAIRKIHSVQVDTDVNGLRTSDTVDAIKLDSSAKEQMVIDDPMYTPALTEPYYRERNRGLRLILSEDGTVTSSKNVACEFRGDMEDLVSDGESSYLTEELDDMGIEWAIKILTETTDPAMSAKAEQTFYGIANAINSRERMR